MMIRSIKLRKYNFDDAVKQTIGIVLAGGIIIYPTDTVYGLGVDATNEQAIRKVFILKRRQEGRGVSSIFQTIKGIKKHCLVSREQEKILRQYLPGPYTFLLKPGPGTKLARQLIDREQGTVGIRIPAYPFTQTLAKEFGRPFTATSANMSGLPSPKNSADVEECLLKPNELSLQGPSIRRGTKRSRNDILFIDAGPLQGVPSTVVDLTKTPPVVVRRGAGRFSPCNASRD